MLQRTVCNCCFDVFKSLHEAEHQEHLQAVHVQTSMPLEQGYTAAPGHQAKAALLPNVAACLSSKRQVQAAVTGLPTASSSSSVLWFCSCQSSTQAWRHTQQQQPGDA